ncbi:MAG: hypothetical protein KBG82_04540 [Spirochaetes bacterium]|jgi:hypothetical protein|nr:hypothetical protein [Spirochaetota bacterium]NLJ04991.1 hypothetical protein [Exilispira sp.]MBP8991225.1 hypothetical protein [Spirochaetota bacterium]HNV43890.1 hypothetical protein [Exilispira sp.]HOV46906.1 hypothetical protein [Exilispira sp.]
MKNDRLFLVILQLIFILIIIFFYSDGSYGRIQSYLPVSFLSLIGGMIYLFFAKNNLSSILSIILCIIPFNLFWFRLIVLLDSKTTFNMLLRITIILALYGVINYFVRDISKKHDLIKEESSLDSTNKLSLNKEIKDSYEHNIVFQGIVFIVFLPLLYFCLTVIPLSIMLFVLAILIAVLILSTEKLRVFLT